MNLLFVIPCLSIVLIGILSLASIFDFRRRPLPGSMRSPFESDRTIMSAELPARRPLRSYMDAWTREIQPSDAEAELAELGGTPCSTCAITRDDELARTVWEDQLKELKAQAMELPTRQA